MPKYSFKRNLFFAIWGGLRTESGLPTTPNMHYINHTMHRVGHTMHFDNLTRIVSAAQEYDKKHLINIKYKIFLSV